jgi:hypothetical protein
MFSRSYCLYRSPELTGSQRIHASRQQSRAHTTEHIA